MTKNWLNLTEMGVAGLSVVGSVAAAITQQVAYASLPLSASVVLNLLNRQKLLGEMSSRQNQQYATLTQEVANAKVDLLVELEEQNQATRRETTQGVESLTKQVQQVQGEALARAQQLAASLQNLEHQHTQLADTVGNLREIENFSQALRVDPNCAEFYYQRGESHRLLGDNQGAIADYSEAIRTKPSIAQAYHKRGILYSELGDRRRGVDDLRKAAKLYFDQGDLDSYQQARDLSKEFYELNSPAPDEKLEKLLIKTFLTN